MAQISLPNQLTNGTVADATQVMANFNAIVDVVNGNLGSDNLGSISGADVTTKDINGGTNTLENFTSRFQAGAVTFENLASNTTGEISVTFPVAFPGSPMIFVGISSAGSPQYVGALPLAISSTGFNIRCWNGYADTRTLSVNWLALYLGAWS